MSKFQKTTMFLLRVALGCLMFYAGISKVLNPEWSAAGFLNGAETFQGFYSWLATGSVLPIVDFVNQWALVLLGLSLIFGIFVSLSSYLGSILMLLYYFPGLNFPYVEHAFIVEEHIIYIFVMLGFAANKAGRTWGLDAWLAEKGGIFAKLG